MKYTIAFLFFIVHSIAHGRIVMGSNCSGDLIKGKISSVGFRAGEALSFERAHETVSVNIEIRPEVLCEVQFVQEHLQGGYSLFPLVGKAIELKADGSFKVSQ